MQDQYLTKEYLTSEIESIDVKSEDLGTTDTYHENKILEKYKKLPKQGKNLVYRSAVQLAIVGYGKKNYGFIRLDNTTTITLIEVFDKFEIRYNENINTKYEEDDLSVRRLLRLFRWQIKQFIEKNNKPSYLWTKYADRSNKVYMSICFPGGEHVVEKKDEAIFLLDTYKRLDEQQHTRFVQRLRRVFIARGILSPTFFNDN